MPQIIININTPTPDTQTRQTGQTTQTRQGGQGGQGGQTGQATQTRQTGQTTQTSPATQAQPRADQEALTEISHACTLLNHYANRWMNNTHIKAGWEKPYYQHAQDILEIYLGQLPDLAQTKQFFKTNTQNKTKGGAGK